MNNHIMQRVQLIVLFVTIIALSFSGCEDIPNSSEDVEAKTLTSVIQNETRFEAVSSNIPDGLLPNSQQYNNSSKPVATGRSGGVTLTARAIINSQMVVDLEVTSGQLDSDEEATGTIAKVRVKALDADNPDPDNPEWEENYNKLDDGGSFTASYENLTRGQLLDIHANVREMFEGKKNSSRTGVISLKESIKYRPDLAVTSITAPTEVFVQDPVTINAEVSENLGDLGATADCVLRIDGDEIDRAAGIWVDAGDAVLCSFQTQFGTTGTKYGEVSVENVIPGDFDNRNNSSTFQIEVIEPINNDFYWSASAIINIEENTIFTNSYGETHNKRGKGQEFYAYGWTANSVGSPMDISVNINSGEHVWLNESLTSVNALYNDYNYSYTVIYLPNNSILEVEGWTDNYSYNETSFYLQRYAQDVVYYGYRYWSGNYYYEYKDTLLPYGDDVTFEVTLDGSKGSATLMGDISLNKASNDNIYYYNSHHYTSYKATYLTGSNSGSPD